MPGKLSITGEISVQPCKSVLSSGWCILILGPTGAGKSSFIEALAGQAQSLGISKDQLAGFTQEVTAYEVKNGVVQLDDDNNEIHPLYLIDAPGFSDSKISELEVITMVKQWMEDHGVWGIHEVLYLSPITDTRVPGSKRRTVKMIQSLLVSSAFSHFNLVTTMWDRLSNPQAKERAETNFTQLQDDIWKGPISRGAKISRYHNDFDSAVQILQGTLESAQFSSPLLGVAPIGPGEAFAPFLYQELLDRINNAQQENKYLRQEKMHFITYPDPPLELVVLSRLAEVRGDLAKFLGQLITFGTPPPGFAGVIPEQWIYQDLLDRINEAREEQAALKVTLAQLHMSPDRVRRVTLGDQLDLAESELVEHVMRLTDPPKRCEKNLQCTIEALILTPPSKKNILNRPNPTADSHITSTHLISDNHTTQTTAHNIVVSATFDQRPSSNISNAVSIMATPGRNETTRRLASETPEGSISSRVVSLEGRFKKGLRFVKDKFTFPSRREDHH